MSARAGQGGHMLLAALLLVSVLASVVVVCAAALRDLSDGDDRNAVTSERIERVKKALFGRLARCTGGVGGDACGGFLSDYGRPYDDEDLGEFGIGELLGSASGPWHGAPAEGWAYDEVNDFWAGYRGSRYLEAPAGEVEFRDGWGYGVEVEFDGDRLTVRSTGSDGAAGGSEGYAVDIEEEFHWRRELVVTVSGIPEETEVAVQVVYPDRGAASVKSEEFTSVGEASHDFHFAAIPAGSRKIVIREGGVSGTVRATRMVCLPCGQGAYSVGLVYEAGGS